MDSKALYIRFLRKLAAADDFASVGKSCEGGNFGEALRRAHNLKGVCASLGLTLLTEELSELVRILRKENFSSAEIDAQLVRIRPEWEKTLALISQLEDA